jgi:hypothetical protein
MVTSGGTEKEHGILKKEERKKERKDRVGRGVSRSSIFFNPEGCMFTTVFARASH